MGSNSLVCLGIELRGFKASTLGFTSALGTLLDFLVQLRMPFDREKEDGRNVAKYGGSFLWCCGCNESQGGDKAFLGGQG
ncbi:hypothetical protein Tco_1521624 [Tanacetum coccineum]